MYEEMHTYAYTYIHTVHSVTYYIDVGNNNNDNDNDNSNNSATWGTVFGGKSTLAAAPIPQLWKWRFWPGYCFA